MNTLRNLLLTGLVAIALTACATSPSPQTNSSDEYQGLMGKWIRDNGGYQLFIDKTADGSLTVRYYNPDWNRWINVDQFSAKKQMWAIQVYIKLQDSGYPGNYYELTLQGGRLTGTYHMLGSQPRTLSVTFYKEN